MTWVGLDASFLGPVLGEQVEGDEVSLCSDWSFAPALPDYS